MDLQKFAKLDIFLFFMLSVIEISSEQIPFIKPGRIIITSRQTGNILMRLPSINIIECVAHCMATSQCVSISYRPEWRMCDLNGDFMDENLSPLEKEVMYSEIRDWSNFKKVIIGHCEGHNCPIGFMCIIDRNEVENLQKCQEVYCPNFPVIPHAIIIEAFGGCRNLNLSIEYACTDQHEMEGLPVATCLPGGIWEIEFSCAKVNLDINNDCETPPVLSGNIKYEVETSKQPENNEGITIARYTVSSYTDEEPDQYCPVSVCSGNKAWSDFNVSLSKKECFVVGNKSAVYEGKNTCTATGKTCQRWDEDVPHVRKDIFKFLYSNTFKDNHCRDFDDGSALSEFHPWCYTTDPETRWERCHIPVC